MKHTKKRFINYFTFLFLLVLVSTPISLYSKKLYSQPSQTKSLRQNRVPFLVSSYKKNPSYLRSLVENYKYGYIDLRTMMQKTITELYSPLINLKEKDPKTLALSSGFAPNLNPGIDSTKYDLRVGNFNICDSDLVVHNHKNFNSPLIFGEIPNDPNITFIPDRSHFPDPTRTQAMLQNKLFEAFPDMSYQIHLNKLCLYSSGDDIIPALSFKVVIDNKPYSIITDDRDVLEFKKLFFSVNGTATIYDKNRTGGLKSVTLSDLDGSGYLTDSHFYTSQASRAYSQSNTFNFNENSDQFRETSVFKNSQDYFTWFSSLGFSWYGGKKIKLVPNVAVDGSTNNAFFAPSASASEDPAIYIGIGDGVSLKDLSIDRDVVSHEFGHFVIFATMQDASEGSETLVLHEGLSDFFVMMRNQSPCLAATVCPSGSSLCMGTCLRNANNSLTAQSAVSEAHAKSLFVSGMLWDMYQADGIPSKDLVDIVFRSLSLLRSRSGYHDFIASMLVSDLANFGMKYCQTILNRAYARGLSPYIQDLRCDPTSISAYTSNNGGSQGGSYSSSGSSHSFCGTINIASSNGKGGPGSGSRSSLALSAVPILLLLFSLARREKEYSQKI